MYALCLAWSFSFQAPSQSTRSRTLGAVLCFAVGAVVGWPFSLFLAVPFVIEEVCVYGKDRVPPEAYGIWIMGRVRRLITCSVVAATIFVSRQITRPFLCYQHSLTTCRYLLSPSIPGHTGACRLSLGTLSNTTFLARPNEDLIYMVPSHGTFIFSICC